MKSILDVDLISNNCCKEPHVVNNRGEVVCVNCGVVYEDKIIIKESAKIYNSDDIKRKKHNDVCSAYGSSTTFGKDVDYKGRPLDRESKYFFHRALKIHNALNNSKSRNLYLFFPHLKRLKNLNLPMYIMEEIQRIYAKSVEFKLTLGRGTSLVVAASAYCATRIHGLHIEFKKFATFFCVEPSDLFKTYKVLIEIILPELNLTVKEITIDGYIETFSKILKFPEEINKLAIELLKKIKSKKVNVSGKDPKGYAAGFLFIALKIYNRSIKDSGKRISLSQQEISKYCKTTSVTLRNRVKAIIDTI